MTAPVTIAQAEAFLRARFGDITDMESFDQGNWSKAYGFQHAGASYVARFSPLDEDFRKDQIASRHASPSLPIPRVVEVGEALGGYYAITERAFGHYLDDLNESEMRAALPSLFAVLDAMRTADITPSTGYGIWTTGGNAPHANWRDALLAAANDNPSDRTYGWRANLAAFPDRLAAFERGMEHLRRLIEFAPNNRHLIHSDLLNYNVLVTDERISAVLDWGCGTYGDFLYDVAWFHFWSTWYPQWAGIDFRAEALRHFDAIGLAISHFDERVTCCAVHVGVLELAYLAFTQRWDDYDWTANRIKEVVGKGQNTFASP